jgi:hypothetical protein
MERVRRELEETEVRDDAGRTLRLGEAWNQRPCIVLFVRHFG